MWTNTIQVPAPHWPGGGGGKEKEEINGLHDGFQLRLKSWRTIIGFSHCLFLQHFGNWQKKKKTVYEVWEACGG